MPLYKPNYTHATRSEGYNVVVPSVRPSARPPVRPSVRPPVRTPVRLSHFLVITVAQIFTKPHTHVCLNHILDKFKYRSSRSKVRITARYLLGMASHHSSSRISTRTLTTRTLHICSQYFA